MKRTYMPCTLCVGIILTVIWSFAACSQAAKENRPVGLDPQMAPGHIILKISKDAAPAASSGPTGRRIDPTAVDRLNSRLGVSKMEVALPKTGRRSPSAAADLGLDRIYVLTFGGAVDPAAAARAYAECPGVEYAEPDWVRRAEWAPDDAYVPEQYALDYIEAPAAWDTTRGSADVVIAIIDTGVDDTHIEFVGKVLTGYDFVDGVTTLDQFGHGTHVAGIVAAEANNSVGIAGVATDCRILPVRVLDEHGSGYTSDCAAGVIWAADNGADVINMSYGSYSYSRIERDAIAYAIRAGVVCVASKGNDGTWQDHYPSDYPGVIAVGATDAADEDWLPSNFGPNTWIKAPGEAIISTMPTYNVTLNNPPYNLSMNYDYMSGTSMASPHVAAAAGIMLSLNPALGPYDVSYLLADTADDMGDPGFDWVYGYGRLNLYQAVQGTLADMTHEVGITNVRTSPSQIMVGQTGEICVDVVNNGNCAESPMSVRVWVDGTLLGSDAPALWPGEETTVRFAWTPREKKTYEVIARCEPRFHPDTARGNNYWPLYVRPAYYDAGVARIAALPEHQYAGTWNRIRITVVNHGAQDEPNCRVKAYVDGAQVETIKLVSVPAGGSADVDFFWAPPTDAPAYFQSTPIPARYTVVARVEPGLGPDANRPDNYMRRNVFVHAHNMSITGVYTSGTPKAGVQGAIRLAVKNNGTRAESDALAKVYVDGHLVSAPVGVSLGAGGSTVVEFPWTPATSGYHTIEARTEPSAHPDVYRPDNYRRATVKAQ